MGFGSTRAEARQLVNHRAVELNGHTADIASILVKDGDTISIREKAKAQLRIRESLDLATGQGLPQWVDRSEEHTSELQSLMRISYAVFCLKKKKQKNSIP